MSECRHESIEPYDYCSCVSCGKTCEEIIESMQARIDALEASVELHTKLYMAEQEWRLKAEARLDALTDALGKAGKLALNERWDTRFPLIFGIMEKAMEAEK